VRREDIRDLTRSVPFEPFRIFMSNGETYDVWHPEMVYYTPGAVTLAASAEDLNVFSLDHIVKIESLPTPPWTDPAD
jgi:hypothetical protein